MCLWWVAVLTATFLSVGSLWLLPRFASLVWPLILASLFCLPARFRCSGVFGARLCVVSFALGKWRRVGVAVEGRSACGRFGSCGVLGSVRVSGSFPTYLSLPVLTAFEASEHYSYFTN